MNPEINSMRKAIFLDRDGIINKKRDDYVKSINEFEFLPEIFSSVRKFQDMGFLIFIITNQSVVGRKIISEKELHEIHNYMIQNFKNNSCTISQIYYCPHTSEKNCNCRKPKSGLLERCIKDFNIDTNQSWMIGDSWSDIQSAENLNIKSIQIPTDQSLSEVISLIKYHNKHPFQKPSFVPSISSIVDPIMENKLSSKFWAEQTSAYYSNFQLQTGKILSVIDKLSKKNSINSVFEFGCHTGRNLYYIKKQFPHILEYGIDINHNAVIYGKNKFNVNIECHDNFLKNIDSNSFDMVYTVSVIDHVANPEQICKELVRISRHYIVLLEPYLGNEGKIDYMINPKTNEKIPFFPFSYSWDYPKIFSKLGTKIISIKQFPLGNNHADPFYHLYEFEKLL